MLRWRNYQIGGKPGQEEPLAGRHRELADIDAPQLLVFEHGGEVGQAELAPRLARFRTAQIDQRTALFQIRDLGRIGARLARRAIGQKPDRAPYRAADAGGEEYRAPAMFGLQHQQQRRQKGQADKLAGSIETDGAAALAIRKPARHHHVVDAVGRRFQCADHRRMKISDNLPTTPSSAVAIDQDQMVDRNRGGCGPPASRGNLAEGIGPAEGRQDPAHLYRVKPSPAHGGCGDGDIAAVQEGDDYADKDHQHDQIALAGRLCPRHLTTRNDPSSCRHTAGASDGRGGCACHRLFIDQIPRPGPGDRDIPSHRGNTRIGKDTEQVVALL